MRRVQLQNACVEYNFKMYVSKCQNKYKHNAQVELNISMPTTLFILLLPSPLGCSCFASATKPFNIACLGAALPGRFRCFALRRRPRAQSPIIPCRPVFEFLRVAAAVWGWPLRQKYASFGRARRCTPAKSRHPIYTTTNSHSCLLVMFLVGF